MDWIDIVVSAMAIGMCIGIAYGQLRKPKPATLRALSAEARAAGWALAARVARTEDRADDARLAELLYLRACGLRV